MSILHRYFLNYPLSKFHQFTVIEKLIFNSSEVIKFFLKEYYKKPHFDLEFCFCYIRFALDNFKFGKVDVGRYPDAAAKYHISDASTTKQLPTLILFKEGKEVDRRPYADHKGKLVKFLFSIVS